MKFEIPYPDQVLKPNVKCHWALKHRAGQRHKSDCYLLAKQIKPQFGDGLIYISMTFHPRTKNKIDRDNAIAAMKWGLDGIAEAWGVDDNRFVPLAHVAEPVKGGKVVIEVLRAENLAAEIIQNSEQPKSNSVPSERVSV